VSIHCAARKQGLRHVVHRVRLVAGEREFIVRLLVRTGISARACVNLVSDHYDVVDTLGPQSISGSVAGRAGADDEGMATNYGDLSVDEIEDVSDKFLRQLGGVDWANHRESFDEGAKRRYRMKL